MSSQIVLMSTHLLNEETQMRFDKLRKDLQDDYEVVLLYNEPRLREDSLASADIESHVFMTDIEKLIRLGYRPIRRTISPGSAHYPLMSFFLEHQNYDFYWQIEYDVFFSGNWRTLVDDCAARLPNTDFLSCHIERYDKRKNGGWGWWRSGNRMDTPIEKLIKSFNPVMRISNEGLKAIDISQREELSAHFEVMLPTLLYNKGFNIADIGGTGSFTPEEFKNKYYIQYEGVNNGTMRWRPCFSMEEIQTIGKRDTLYHPLK